MAETKDLILINPEIGTRDYFPKADVEGKTFTQIADDLHKKYQEQIFNYAKGQLRNLETPDRKRVPLSFYYTDQQGNETPIDHSDLVTDVMKISSSVFWSIKVVGGADNFLQVFGNHALEIIYKPKYRNWKCIVDEKPGFGIKAVGPDKDGIIRQWEIKPSANYPMSPPIITSTPPFSNDPCWDTTGTLHYTRFDKGGTPWEEKARKSTNPLFSLMIELLQKYIIGV